MGRTRCSTVARSRSSRRAMPSACRPTRRCWSGSREPSSPRCSRRRPTRSRDALGDLVRLARTGWRFLKLGRDGPRAVEILTAPARTILDRWFESDEVKATLATDAIIGAMASPSTPGTAYVLFHHVMGECNGARGVWGYVKGGMGSLSEALADAARTHGAEDANRRAGREGAGRGRPGHRRGARGRGGDPCQARGLERRRHRDAAGTGGGGAPSRRRGRGRAVDRLLERFAEGEPRPLRAAQLHGPSRPRRRPPAPGHHPPLPEPRLHRAGLRRRTRGAAVGLPRFSSAPSRRSWIRAWRRPVAT